MKINRECVKKALNEGFRVVILYKDPSMDLILTRDVISIENVKRVEINKFSMNMLVFKY